MSLRRIETMLFVMKLALTSAYVVSYRQAQTKHKDGNADKCRIEKVLIRRLLDDCGDERKKSDNAASVQSQESLHGKSIDLHSPPNARIFGHGVSLVAIAAVSPPARQRTHCILGCVAALPMRRKVKATK